MPGLNFKKAGYEGPGDGMRRSALALLVALSFSGCAGMDLPPKVTSFAICLLENDWPTCLDMAIEEGWEVPSGELAAAQAEVERAMSGAPAGGIVYIETVYESDLDLQIAECAEVWSDRDCAVDSEGARATSLTSPVYSPKDSGFVDDPVRLWTLTPLDAGVEVPTLAARSRGPSGPVVPCSASIWAATLTMERLTPNDPWPETFFESFLRMIHDCPNYRPLKFRYLTGEPGNLGSSAVSPPWSMDDVRESKGPFSFPLPEIGENAVFPRATLKSCQRDYPWPTANGLCATSEHASRLMAQGYGGLSAAADLGTGGSAWALVHLLAYRQHGSAEVWHDEAQHLWQLTAGLAICADELAGCSPGAQNAGAQIIRALDWASRLQRDGGL